MKRFYLTMLALLCYTGVWAQCYPTGVTFTTQQQIDDFAMNNPGCTEILGELRIEGMLDSTAITNLNGLSPITTIGGSLVIYGNDGLTSLDGLNNLATIGGNLELGKVYQWQPELVNEMLSDISALSNLMSIGGSLHIEGTALMSLTGLENIQTIPGDFTLYKNDFLTNLSGLNNLTIIGNTLEIGYESFYSVFEAGNPALTDLTGLSNLSNIGLNLRITGNGSLVNLTGLENITTIPGELGIYENDGLINLTGLDNLTTVSFLKIGYVDEEDWQNELGNISLESLSALSNLTLVGGLEIAGNHALTNLTGLENIDSLFFDLSIYQNDGLIDLTGLDDLEFIGGNLRVGYINTGEYEAYLGNDVLVSLNGLNSLKTIGGNLYVADNALLGNFSGLENLNSVNGISVRFNPSLGNITDLSGLTSIPGYLYMFDNESLNSLAGLDNVTFINDVYIGRNNALLDFSGLGSLTTIGGGLSSGRFDVRFNLSLKNFNGLENLTSINYWFEVEGNPALERFDGLINLNVIGGDTKIAGNYNLTDFSGLNNLATIDGNLQVDNNGLNNFNGLNNLEAIEGRLEIYNNVSLTSLSGLNNIDYTKLTDLRMTDNPNLSYCAVAPVCDYLNNNLPNLIGNNAFGCDGEIEVINVCAVPATSPETLPEMLILPNPTTGIFEVAGIPYGKYEITSTTGQVIQSGKITEGQSIDISGLSKGIYFLSVTTNEVEIITERIIRM